MRSRKDGELRRAVHEAMRDKANLVLDEVGIWMGASVVDVAVLSPEAFTAFELKSAEDTLRRLPGQVQAAGMGFDRVVVACAPEHLAKVLEIVPGWAGVWVAGEDSVRRVREAEASPFLDEAVRASLLWRPEVARALRAMGVRPKGRRPELWAELARRTEPGALRELIVEALRRRSKWVREHTWV